MDTIWSIRLEFGLQLVKYKLLSEDTDSYIIQDTTCKDHINCEIRISKDFKYVEPMNDSAREYESFHNQSRYFGSEKEAKNVFYTEAKDIYKEKLESIKKLIINIENFLKYSKSKRYNKIGGVSYGSDIYTFNHNVSNIRRRILNEDCSNYNDLLDKYIFKYKVNSMEHVYSILNDVEKKEKHYYIDLRGYDVADYSKVFVEVIDDEKEIIIKPKYDIYYEHGDYEHNYYAGANLRKGATSKNNCRCLIIKELEIGLENSLSEYKSSSKKYEEKINEFDYKLLEVKE